MTTEWSRVLDAVAARVSALPPPVRVGVDGITASGKTTFADALVARACRCCA